jgi:hypothetical protein
MNDAADRILRRLKPRKHPERNDMFPEHEDIFAVFACGVSDWSK